MGNNAGKEHFERGVSIASNTSHTSHTKETVNFYHTKHSISLPEDPVERKKSQESELSSGSDCSDYSSEDGDGSSDTVKALFGEKTYIFTNYGPIKIYKLFKLAKYIKSQLLVYNGESFYKLPKIYKVKVNSEVTKVNVEEGQSLICSVNCVPENYTYIGCCSDADTRTCYVDSKQYGINQANKYKRYGRVKGLDVLFIKNKINLDEFLEGWASVMQGEIIGNYDAILDLYYICAFNDKYVKMDIEQGYCRLTIVTKKPRTLQIFTSQATIHSFMYGLNVNPKDKIVANNFEIVCK